MTILGLKIDNCLFPSDYLYDLENLIWIKFVSEPNQKTNVEKEFLIGLTPMYSYLAGKINQQEMRDLSIAATRQLAKRQLTWLRSWQNQHQLSMESTTLIEDAQNYFEQAIK